MTRKKKKDRSRGGGRDRKAGAESPAPAGQGRPSWLRYAVWRENLEAFIIAVILAVIIRHFSVEAFEIPTGSMATTLYGMHAWLECPNCSTPYNVALKSDSSTGKISVPYQGLLVYEGLCPNPQCNCRLHSRGPRHDRRLRAPGDLIRCGACGNRFRGKLEGYRRVAAIECDARCPICHHIEKHAVILQSNQYGGHKILVTKFSYVVGSPQRWDVIVFEFDQWKNYIKRLVGLPGERVAVWDGDLYINGAIERKHARPSVQEALWTKISDSDVGERGLNPVPAWKEIAPAESRRTVDVAKNAEWDGELKRWSINAQDDAVLLRYQRGFDNYYSYNLLSPQQGGVRGWPPNIQVGDKRVAFTARVIPSAPAPSGQRAKRRRWVGAEIRDGDFCFRVEIPTGTPSEKSPATLTRLVTPPEGAPRVDRPPHPDNLAVSRPVAIEIGTAARIDFENVDDRAAVKLNGEEILALEYRSIPEGSRPQDLPPSPGLDFRAHYVDIVASNVQVEISSIQVYRDLYYIARNDRGPWRGIQLEDGQYFAMGDNAPSSSDGRYWGWIPKRNLMGKAFVVFWPALPTNFQCKFIR